MVDMNKIARELGIDKDDIPEPETEQPDNVDEIEEVTYGNR